MQDCSPAACPILFSKPRGAPLVKVWRFFLYDRLIAILNLFDYAYTAFALEISLFSSITSTGQVGKSFSQQMT